MTLEHKPCAYCSLLLSAILMSTCSWNIASFDVSPVYKTSPPISKLNNQQQQHQTSSSSFIKSVISFFTSSKLNKQDRRNLNLKHEEEEEEEVIVSKVGFESLTSKLNHQDQDEKLKINHNINNSFNRCWCFSNFGKLFQPVSIRNSNRPHQQQQQQQEENLKSLHHDDDDDSSNRDHIKKDHQNFDYNSIVTTRKTNDKEEDDESDGENEEEGKKSMEIRKPKRHLKTLLSPLWKPLTKLTMTRSTEPEEGELPRPRTTMKTMTRIKEKEKKKKTTSTPSSEQPPTRTYRSSFSRTPLVYSHIIEPSINFIKSKLDHLSIPILHRLFVIFKYNLYELWSHKLLILPIPTSYYNYSYLTSYFSSFNQSKFFKFFKLSYSRYLENIPFEIRLVGLPSLVNINKSSLGLRIFLGSRPLSSPPIN